MRWLVLALCGCDVVFGVPPPSATICASDGDCMDAAGGVCDCGHCSYLATSCELSNRKWPASAPGALADACVPVPTQIDARVFHTCMRMSDGTAWCWGSNSDHQLGARQPVGTASSYPVQIVDAADQPLRDVAEIRTSAAASCARLRDGTVWCWGTNAHGELGAGLDTTSTPRSAVPVQVMDAAAPLTGALAIAMGYNYACAVVGDSEVRCWGWNTSGVLGEPSTTTPQRDRATFALTFDRVRDLATGGEHACVVSETMDGVREAYCWGQQGAGRLGNGVSQQVEQPVPARVLWSGNVPIPDLLDIAAGNRHTCAFKLPGRELYCWGPNEVGQLGDGTQTGHAVAARVSHDLAQNVDALSSGQGHSCMTSGTETWCWGGGESGELGTGATEPAQLVPVRTQLDKQLRSLTSGHSHSCAIGSDLLVRCWGSNQNGELGDGSVDTRLAPTTIARETYCPSRE